MSAAVEHGSLHRREFAGPVEEVLLCPVCRCAMVEATMATACGHTFCLGCAERLESCPLDGEPVRASPLVPNRLVEMQARAIPLRCRFPPCLEAAPMSALLNHEASCQHALATCPYSEACGSFARNDLIEHVHLCTRAPCSAHLLGCNIQSTPAGIREHVKTCPFVRDPAPAQRNEISRITTEIDSLRSSIAALLHRMEQVDSSNTSLQAAIVQQQSAVEAVREVGSKTHLAPRTPRRPTIAATAASQPHNSNNNNHNNQHSNSLQAASLQEGLDLGHASQGPLNHDPNSLATSNNSARAESGQTPLPLVEKCGSTVSPALASSEEDEGAGEVQEEEDLSQEEPIMPFTYSCIGTFRGHTGPVWALVSYKDYLLSGSSDEMIKVWDMNKYDCIRSLRGHSGVVHSLAVHGDTLYSGDSVGKILMWDLTQLARPHEDMSAIKEVVASKDIISRIEVLGAKGLLVSASYGGLKMWKDNLTCINGISGLGHWVRALAVSEPQRALFSACGRVISLWDTHTLSFKGTMETNYGSIHSLAVTKDFIITGTYNQNIIIYDINTRQPLQHLTGHVSSITSLLLSPLSTVLYTASCDGVVKVWDLSRGLLVQQMARHSGGVNVLAWHRGLLVSGSVDTDIKLYKHQRGKTTNLD